MSKGAIIFKTKVTLKNNYTNAISHSKDYDSLASLMCTTMTMGLSNSSNTNDGDFKMKTAN